MKKKKTIIKTSILLIFLIVFISCNPLENETLSNSLLVILSLMGTNTEGAAANYLQSDVITNNTIYADTANVTFTAKLLNPSLEAVSSQYNSIMITHYTVSYFRSDGKNTEGVDIPYFFEGHLSTLIGIGDVTEISFVIVREVAKLELPLINLQDGRGEGVLQMQARVDFYGHDLANKTVKATGYLTIFFANYADPDE